MIKSIKWNGKPVVTPGIYSNIPLEDYHSANICDGPSVSSSGLRKMWAESPAHFWDTSPINPEAEPEKVPDHFVLGHAAHHVICGEAFFAEKYIIRPAEYQDEKTGELKPWNNNANVCKRWNAGAALQNKTILKPEQAEAIRGMALRLGLCSLMQQGILNGMIERSIFWQDKETGLWLKARPDAIPNDSGDFADLKTTESVLDRDLMRTLENFGYSQQGALVLEGARAVGLEASTFSLVFVEKGRPYCVRPVQLTDEDLARGHKMNHAALRMIAECMATNNWPGPGEDGGIEYLRLSDDARKRIDKRLENQTKAAVCHTYKR